jgi:NAD(P)-dependent dehydrogenase (short-subunit alcohol dehydrogenase family)
MGNTFSQIWPPTPTITESNLPSQQGKIFIVTGGYSGVGFALAQILYDAGGTVYIAGRSKEKAEQATRAIATRAANSRVTGGQIKYPSLDLSDLRTIKPAVETFAKQETMLHALFNNAGVSSCPPEWRTPQGIEMQMGTNAVGPYILTQLLMPFLRAAAQSAAKSSVRVVWTSSIAAEQQAPKGGLNLEHLAQIPADRYLNYANSKTANVLLCSEMGKKSRAENDGVLHVVQNPGNLSTNLLRHIPLIISWLVSPLLYEARYGAYTEVWCGFSDQLDFDHDQGSYIMPWGRKHPGLRPDILDACKSKEDGGTGVAELFRMWCDEQVKGFA